jgi:hypothetical protein
MTIPVFNFYQHPERRPGEVFVGNVPVGFSTLTELQGGSKFKYKREGEKALDSNGIQILALRPFFGLESEYLAEGIPGIHGVTQTWEEFYKSHMMKLPPGAKLAQ